MPKRPRADSSSVTSVAIKSLFEELFAIANASKPADSATLRILRKLKDQALSAKVEKESIRKAAKEFTLDEAVLDFGLTYSSSLKDAAKHLWKIEMMPEFKTLEPSASLVSLLENYTTIYKRSSEAGCKIAMDFLLCECIAVMRGKVSGISPTELTEDGRRTPTLWDTVKVHCEVSFNHIINPMPTPTRKTGRVDHGIANSSLGGTIVGGLVDHGIGIVIRSPKVPNRRFYSLLLCVLAKVCGNVNSALAQLVVYLACLHQSRVNRGRSNTSVYGVATYGLSYIFLIITQEGVLKLSRLFNVMQEDLSTVLGSLRYILEMAMSMTPNVTPEKGALMESDELEDDDPIGDPIDLDDNPYLHSDDEQ